MLALLASAASCAPDDDACCAADSDCSAGALCFEGLCVAQCDDESQCREGEACVAGACVAPLRAPGHCPFEDKRSPRRPIVDGGAPVPDAGEERPDAGPVDPPCEDGFEPNDSREQAAVVLDGSSLDASICPAEDDDWYRLDVPAGAADLSLVVRFEHDDGDLDVEIIDEGGERVAVSQLTGDVEEIRLPVTGPRELFVHVYGFGRATNTYTLEVDLLPPTVVCADDALEDNDSDENPTLIAPGALSSAAFCSGDPDVYTTWIDGDFPSLAILSYERGDELTLEARGLDVPFVLRSTTFSGVELVPFALDEPSTVNLRVSGTHAHVDARPYHVGVWVADDTCGLDAFEPDGMPALAGELAVQAAQGEGFSAVQARLCERDLDYWRLSWRADASSVELELSAAPGTRAYVVREGDLSLIAPLSVGQPAVIVPGIDEVSGDVLVVITGAGGDASYQLRGRTVASE